MLCVKDLMRGVPCGLLPALTATSVQAEVLYLAL